MGSRVEPVHEARLRADVNFRNKRIYRLPGNPARRLVCLLRFLCSFFSGYIVWKDYDYAFEWLNNFGWGAWFTANLGEDALCWFYSFAYNFSYMLPETILTVVGAVVLYKAAPRLFRREG